MNNDVVRIEVGPTPVIEVVDLPTATVETEIGPAPVIEAVAGSTAIVEVVAPGGGGGAPTDAQYLVAQAHAGLSAERVLTNTATVVWDTATAGQVKANVPDGSISYAKIRDFTGSSKLLGRGGFQGPGDPQEISVGIGLNMTESNLSVNGTNSLTSSAVGISLVNDTNSPGPSMYYGTNAAGVKGWHALP